MAENLTADLFNCPEFLVEVIVPGYWRDQMSFDDSASMDDTATVKGIYDNDPLSVDLGLAGVETFNPTVTIKTADIPYPQEGDTITVDGTEYRVGTPRPDDQGTTEIDLYKQT